MYREQCVICASNVFEDIFTLHNYPICVSPTLTDPKSDIFEDLIYKGCVKCGCVQLITLIDPSVLYSQNHNNTYNTETWRLHHIAFANFVANAMEDDELLEIGGNNGVLANLILSQKNVNYTIIDMCKDTPISDKFTFINANAETYVYKTKSMVMSHVFEHLYNPRQFVQKIANENVEHVFISVPNITALIKSKNILPLHVEHTFFCSSAIIQKLFAESGYTCKEEQQFKNHSIFFHFNRLGQQSDRVFNELCTMDEIKCAFTEGERLLKNIVIKEHFYIAPAGLYGQRIYYTLQPYNHLLLGFLDNDPSKIGCRVYGTPNYVFAPSELEKHAHIHVVLYGGPYSDEIKSQYIALNPNITFITI